MLPMTSRKFDRPTKWLSVCSTPDVLPFTKATHYITPFQHNAIPTKRHSNTTPFRHNAIPTQRHSNTTPCQHNDMPTQQHSDTTTFRHNNIPTQQHSNTTQFRHIARNTFGCAQVPAARLTGPSALQGLLLLYPARALIVRPYADSSKLS